jgi:hypothetical protein
LLLGQPDSIQAGVYLTREERIAKLDAIFSKHLTIAATPSVEETAQFLRSQRQDQEGLHTLS